MDNLPVAFDLLLDLRHGARIRHDGVRQKMKSQVFVQFFVVCKPNDARTFKRQDLFQAVAACEFVTGVEVLRHGTGSRFVVHQSFRGLRFGAKSRWFFWSEGLYAPPPTEPLSP